MRGFGFGAKRNDPVRLTPLNPRPKSMEPDETGDAGQDGYSILSRANPHYAGQMPSVPGQAGQTHQGPDQSWEQ